MGSATVQIGAAVVVDVVVVDVVVAGAGVVVVVVVAGVETTPEQLPGGMQRLFPLGKTQQTQPGLHVPGLLAQITFPQ